MTSVHVDVPSACDTIRGIPYLVCPEARIVSFPKALAPHHRRLASVVQGCGPVCVQTLVASPAVEATHN